MDAQTAEARRDVLAYMRAMVSNQNADAGFIVSQALDTNPAAFVFQLSTFCATTLSLAATLLDTTPEDFVSRIQATELDFQAAGA